RHAPLQLEPREMRAQADVLPDAEAQVRVRVAVDAEPERIVKDGLVAVRRGIEEAEVLTRGDRRAVQVDVLGRRPAELDDWAGPADDLLRGWPRHAGRITLELRELAAVVQESAEAAGDGVPCRLVPGDDEQHEVGHQLEPRDRLAVHARG